MTLEATLTRIADALEQIANNGRPLVAVNPGLVPNADLFETLGQVTAEPTAPQVQAPAETPKAGGRPRKGTTKPAAETPAADPTPPELPTAAPVAAPDLVPTTAPSPEAAVAPSYDDITKEVTKLAALGGREAVLEVFKALGNINRLQDLDKSRYGEAKQLFDDAVAARTVELNDDEIAF